MVRNVFGAGVSVAHELMGRVRNEFGAGGACKGRRGVEREIGWGFMRASAGLSIYIRDSRWREEHDL